MSDCISEMQKDSHKVRMDRKSGFSGQEGEARYPSILAKQAEQSILIDNPSVSPLPLVCDHPGWYSKPWRRQACTTTLFLNCRLKAGSWRLLLAIRHSHPAQLAIIAGKAQIWPIETFAESF